MPVVRCPVCRKQVPVRDGRFVPHAYSRSRSGPPCPKSGKPA